MDSKVNPFLHFPNAFLIRITIFSPHFIIRNTLGFQLSKFRKDLHKHIAFRSIFLATYFNGQVKLQNTLLIIMVDVFYLWKAHLQHNQLNSNFGRSGVSTTPKIHRFYSSFLDLSSFSFCGDIFLFWCKLTDGRLTSFTV